MSEINAIEASEEKARRPTSCRPHKLATKVPFGHIYNMRAFRFQIRDGENKKALAATKYKGGLARIFHQFSVAIAASSSWALRFRRFRIFFDSTTCFEVASRKIFSKRLTSLRIGDFTTKPDEISGLVILRGSS